MEARPNPEARPYVWKGRPYERLGPTTSVMPQSTYQRLLTERDQQGGRWENLAARGWKPADLDSEEILRTVRLGISAGRMPESTGHDVTDILNRLGLLAGEEARRGRGGSQRRRCFVRAALQAKPLFASAPGRT